MENACLEVHLRHERWRVEADGEADDGAEVGAAAREEDAVPVLCRRQGGERYVYPTRSCLLETRTSYRALAE